MYRLINRKTGESHLCDKVIIDGFDYYANYPEKCCIQKEGKSLMNKGCMERNHCEKFIATNNPNIDFPKVVDEVERLADVITPLRIGKEMFKEGYNKAKETHSNSDEDMIEFGDWCENLQKNNKEIRRNNPDISRKELLQIFKQHRSKKIYYE